MKLTAMIEHLQALLEKHGDQDCFYGAEDGCSYAYDESSSHNLPSFDKYNICKSSDYDCFDFEEREGIHL